jgi:hypothetical protein
MKRQAKKRFFMNAAKRVTSTFFILLLITLSVLGADPWISFGPLNDTKTRIGFGFERYPGLRVTAPNTQNNGLSVLNDSALIKQTGGLLLVSTAQPHPNLAKRRLRLQYDPNKDDGSRFGVKIGTETFYMDLFDWEAKPLVEFVDSGHHGGIDADRYGKNSENRLYTLDDSFQGRLLGLRFIQADILPRGIIASEIYLPRDTKGNLFLGDGESQWRGTEKDVNLARETLIPLLGVDFRTSVSTNSGNDKGAIVLTDAGESFIFSVSGDRFVIQGTPYYFFWSESEGRVIPNRTLNQKFRNSWSVIKRANPLVIRAAERAFRATAFFRYQQQNYPVNWRAFVRQMPDITIAKVPTPRHLEPIAVRSKS